MATLLIPIATLKANSYIEQNVDAGKLRQAALEAQRVEVRGILGATLTDFLLSSIATATGAPTGLTTVRQEFFEQFVVPMMAAATEAQFVYAGHYQISNTGLAVVKGSNTDPASDDAVNAAYRRAMNRFDYYASRAKKYILDSTPSSELQDFYYASNQNIQPAKKTFSGLIYTGSNHPSDDCCPTR